MLHKINILTILLCLFLYSCTKENDLQVDTETSLSIRVVDSGYTGDSSSRTTYDGFKTTFEDGDRIGVFVVDYDGEISHRNVPITYRNDKWEGDLRIKKTTSRVFAYYPYVDSNLINSKVDGTAESASDFFKSYIDDLDISNQSTLDAFKSADFLASMVSSENISDNTVTFQMSHQLSLLLVKFYVRQPLDFTLTTDVNYEWHRTAYIDVTPSFDKFSAFKIDGGDVENDCYKLLVRSSDSPITGIFTKDGEKRKFSLSTIPQSSYYKEYHVSALLETTGKATHELKIGDLYKNDGGLIGQRELHRYGIVEEEKPSCVGVVFLLDQSRIGKGEKEFLAEKGVTTPHGLVMAVKNAARNVKWQTSDVDSKLPNTLTIALAYPDIEGFSNSNLIGLGNTQFPAFKAAGDYKVTCKVPERTTGWYLPSFGQLWNMWENLSGCDLTPYKNLSDGWKYTGIKNLENKMSDFFRILGDGNMDLIGKHAPFWSSTEYNYGNGRYIGTWDVNDTWDEGLWVSIVQNITPDMIVRCILAF